MKKFSFLLLCLALLTVIHCDKAEIEDPTVDEAEILTQLPFGGPNILIRTRAAHNLSYCPYGSAACPQTVQETLMQVTGPTLMVPGITPENPKYKAM